MNVIRCDLKEYLVWKWRPQFIDSDNPGQRANFIRWGSSLRIKDGEMAIFVYRGVGADVHENQDVIMGPYDGAIETANLPVISKIVGLAYGGGQGGLSKLKFISSICKGITKYYLAFLSLMYLILGIQI